ncbi:MAG: macro domain-containing protein [Myxococcota bacterium]|nr:macro domain-containing protein [Myxococcota bacterium]
MVVKSICSIKVVEGDLLEQNVDVIVHPWHRNVLPWWLLPLRGISKRIKARAGAQPFVELGRGPIPLGGARLTSAGRLNYQGIIHVAGVDLIGRTRPDVVSNAVHSACAVARGAGYARLAMPILNIGAAGPQDVDALHCILSALRTCDHALDVTVVQCRVTVMAGARAAI